MQVKEEYIRAMRGYNAKLDEFYAASLNRVMDFTFAMTGNDAQNFVESMDNLVTGMTDMMTSKYAKGAAVAFGTAFGEMAYGPFMRVMGADNSEDRDFLDVLKVTGMVGGGMGVLNPTMAKALQGLPNARAMLRGAEAGLSTMFPEFVEKDDTGASIGFDYDNFFEKIGTMTVEITGKSITDLTTSFHNLVKS